MTKIRNLAFLVGLALALLAGPANAFLINFDNLAPDAIIDGVDLGRVTISSAPGYTQVKANGTSGAGWASPYNAITNYDQIGFLDGMATQPLTITFAVPQASMSITGGDDGRSGDLDQFTVTAYDSAHHELGSITTPVFGGNTYNGGAMVDHYTVNLNFAGMKSVVVSNAINYGIALDDLQFCEVPVPPTLLLLGSGLLSLVGLRRKVRL